MVSLGRRDEAGHHATVLLSLYRLFPANCCGGYVHRVRQHQIHEEGLDQPQPHVTERQERDVLAAAEKRFGFSGRLRT